MSEINNGRKAVSFNKYDKDAELNLYIISLYNLYGTFLKYRAFSQVQLVRDKIHMWNMLEKY